MYNNINNTTEQKKMTENETLFLMLNAINIDRKDLFYKAAEEYQSSLARGGDAAFRIKRLLNEKPKFFSLHELPQDIKGLVRQASDVDENAFLNEEVKKLLDELVIEWQNVEAYKFHNLPVRNKILLHGITGNGKTTIARHIAKMVNLPFMEINSDIVVDSHLGSTGGNIFKIFEKIKQPCVLFWDEIDSIGSKRSGNSDNSATYENNRMVNSILINLEKMSDDVVFIGATNRYDILDSAFLRRFHVQFEIKSPTEVEKQNFVKQLMNYYSLPDMFVDSDVLGHNSYSDIKNHFVDIARRYVIEKIKATS